MSQACAAVGATAHTDALYRLALPHGHCVIKDGSGAVCLGSFARYLGMLATTLGRFDDAERHFDESDSMNSRLRAGPLLAHTNVVRARMHLARHGRGDRRRACVLLEEASERFERFGMSYHASRARDLLDRPDLAAARLRPRYPDGLTQRESEILGLIAAGASSREVSLKLLCASFAALEYPQTRYQVVLIDDGSRDGTGEQMETCVRGRPGWFLLSLPENVGKASALNIALTRVPFGEIVIVFDADHRPRPDVLKRAVTYFDHDRVAGVSGWTLALNPLASPSAYYSAVEGSVHQMVTMRAKDRLGLAPALLGSNCAYRRSALARCGGFRTGALLEDSDLTLAFYRDGYVVRFAEDMVSYHQVPETVDGYIKQHTRWARGFNDVAQSHAISLARDRRLPLSLRFELILFATGYLDRIALAGAVILSLLVLAVVTTGCGPAEKPEARVRAVIDAGERSAEARDLSALMDLVSPAYEQGGGPDELKQYLRGYLVVNQSVHLLTRVDSIEFPYWDYARVQLTVGTLGREAAGTAAFDVAGDVYEVALELRLEGDEWKVTRAAWESTRRG